MKIGDLFIGLLVDAKGELKAQIEKEAEAAGDAGGKVVAQRFSAALKVGSALVGAGFALMTKGALQMEDAQGRFQAATGKSREEAVAFSKDMNALVGTAAATGRSFEEIVDAGIAVEQQFQVTGDEQRELTADVLAFARVTGQDAVNAAFQLEDTLSAYNLTAADAAPLMDKLVASNQKFGTDAGPQTLAILQGMAPALQAMGLGLDDGVELLNAFEVAGLDAGAAQKGLQAAVNELKPGDNLDDLIARIAAIEDPLLRNQAAVDIFGAKAGPGLAKIIQPGMTSLDDFGISADEAAGKVDKAADDMLTTSDKIKNFFDGVLSKARDFGAELGPALSGAASLVSFAPGIKAAWDKVASTGLVKSAIDRVGDWSGALYAGAAFAKEKLVEAASTAWSFVKGATKGTVEAAGDAVGEVFGSAVGDGAGEMVATGATGTVVGNLTSQAAYDKYTKGGLSAGKVIGRAIAAGTAIGFAAGAGAVVLVVLDETGKLQLRLHHEWSEEGEAAGLAYFSGLSDSLHGEVGAHVKKVMDDLIAGGMSPVRAEEQAIIAGKKYLIGLTNGALSESDHWNLTLEQILAAIPADKAGYDIGRGAAEGTWEGWRGAYGAVQAQINADIVAGQRSAGEQAAVATADGWRAAYGAVQAQINADIVAEQQAAAARGLEAFGDRWVAYGEAEYARWAAPFRALGSGVPGEIGAGMRAEQDQLWDAANDLRELLRTGLTPEDAAMRAIGEKNVQLVRRGMVSEIPGAKEDAQQVALGMIDTIENAGLTGAKGRRGLKAMGEYYDALLASGMTAAQARVFLVAGGVAEGTVDVLEGKAPAFETAGGNVASAWARGFAAHIRNSKRTFDAALANATGSYRGLSPPKEGPLMHIDDDAGNVGEAWRTGFIKGLLGDYSGPLRQVAAQLLGFAPSHAWASLGSLDAGVGGTLHHEHVHRLEVPAETARAFRDAGYDESAIVRTLSDLITGAQTHAGRRWQPEGSF